ncbi:Alkaline phosphatase (plasmid) [Rhodovulum sp. P5]|uniref:PA14 domain-containing protein n=1 Tax=Rhodovulum sp. P5 TaxID=1564506 RepID=UPI0009C386BF|nr:PA14 domain-containing protein [Rhodovulum sp. P5]ARE42355.1 Alkaline phosphatase [Rhodovulum sp. P5]
MEIRSPEETPDALQALIATPVDAPEPVIPEVLANEDGSRTVVLSTGETATVTVQDANSFTLTMRDAQGNVLFEETINDPSTSKTLAIEPLEGGQFVLSRNDPDLGPALQIYDATGLVRETAEGVLLSSSFPDFFTDPNAVDRQIVALGDGGFVLLDEITGARRQINAVLLDENLNPVSSVSGLIKQRITGGSNTLLPAADVLANGNIVITFAEKDGRDSDLAFEIYDISSGVFELIASADNRDGRSFVSGSNVGNTVRQSDVVALDDGGFAIVWNDTVSGNRMFVERFTADGKSAGGKQGLPIDGIPAEIKLTNLGGDGISLSGQGIRDIKIDLSQTKQFFSNTSEVIDGGDAAGFVDARGGNDLVRSGGGDDEVFGGAGNDTLLGGDGDDSLDGGSGNDLMDGGAGRDRLFGGTGFDVYSFSTDGIANFGADTLFGFTFGQDRIDLSAVASVTGFDDLTITQRGSSAVIDTGVGTIRLPGVVAADIRPFDFVGLDKVTLNGMTATYFNVASNTVRLDQIDFRATPIFEEQVTEISEATTGSFFAGGPADHFAVLYHGAYLAEEAGTYRFSLKSDDGSELWIDGVRVIDNDGLHGPATLEARVELDEGAHSIELRYFESRGGATVELGVVTPGSAVGEVVDFTPVLITDPLLIEGRAAGETLKGREGDDTILGAGGNDSLLGRGGDDILEGGSGDDIMTGGAGADVFVFNIFREGDADEIMDFEDGADTIMVRIADPETGRLNLDACANGLEGLVDALDITDVVGGAQMSVDGHLVLIHGVSAADLTIDDFQFV